ncbi:MAG: hypothetical protein ACJ0QA_02375 [Flavobacteriaceae bacterium]|jgi:hypothetical protein
MKNSIFISLLFINISQAQLSSIKIKDFIDQHNSFEQNDAGEVNAINDKEINKLIRFFIQEKFYGLVELTRSIVWDSYETFISPTKRNQLSKYIIQVKVKDVERLKYLEVLYNPHEKKVDTNFEWDSRDEEFNLLNEQALAQKKIPNLFKLEISNQDDIPNINEFILQHQGFIDEIERLNLSEKEIVPINAANINELIRSFNNSNFTNLEYTRNVIWNSYNTFVSPFDRYHFHTFIAQVKVEGIDRLKYLEVFYNPVNDKITSDFKWSDDKNEYLRVN